MANNNSANIGFETKLWATADKLRGHMDSAEYKHVVLGLIFLKYISDSFEETYQSIKNDKEAFDGEWEDKDAYKARNVFWVPENARWNYLKENAKKPEIGKIIDDAMIAIEKENPTLKGVLPKRYARPDLNKQRLGEIVDIFSSLGLGDEASKSKDILGRVYEYFIGRFASAEGKGGGEFYTPASVVKLLVQMIEPYNGRVYDPCCGSGGMFVQSEKFVEEHGGKVSDIAVYGQESNATTWRLAKMNLAIRGIENNLGESEADSFHNDQHKDLKADFILANPPFNMSDWGGERLKDDVRWKYGVPPTGNANYAWIQHFIHHLSPTGIAGFVLADSSMSTMQKDEYEIRKNIVENGIVDCIVSLPSHLFTNTQITACLWFLSRKKENRLKRKRKNETLFIDASKLGKVVGRKSRVLTEKDIEQISDTYHEWRNLEGEYIDIPGFCASIDIEEIKGNKYVLSPNRYIKTVKQELMTTSDIENSDEYEKFLRLKLSLEGSLKNISHSVENNKIAQLSELNNSVMICNQLSEKINEYFQSYIKKYFILDENSISENDKSDWEPRRFGDLFSEKKLKVSEIGFTPPLFSVTNNGIQSRESNFSKELTHKTASYKVAHRGDLVFGLSREIPNLDVMKEPVGAFSGAYHIYEPHDQRIGLIIGTIMRIRLMEQSDILKRGAREGRGLDKDKLENKHFYIPKREYLDQVWGVEMDS